MQSARSGSNAANLAIVSRAAADEAAAGDVKTVAQLGVVVTLATELAVANTNGQL